VTKSRTLATNVDGRKPMNAPGSRKVESILVAATASLFAEGERSGDLGRCGVGEILHLSGNKPTSTTDGVLVEVRGGEPPLSLSGSKPGKGGLVLRSSLGGPRLVRSSSFRPPSALPTVESWCRLARDIAKSGDSGRLTFWATLRAQEKAPSVLRGSRARQTSKDAWPHACCTRRTSGSGKRRALGDDTGGNARHRHTRRGLDARGRARASSEVAEVGSWLFGAEKRRFSTSTDLDIFGDGRLALSFACESTGGSARKAPGLSRSGNSRDRRRDQSSPWRTR